jgi:hypothetical protein
MVSFFLFCIVMMNITEIHVHFPSKNLGEEFISSRNLLEVIREDGSGYRFNLTLYVGGKEVSGFIAFNPVSKRSQRLVINGEEVKL